MGWLSEAGTNLVVFCADYSFYNTVKYHVKVCLIVIKNLGFLDVLVRTLSAT